MSYDDLVDRLREGPFADARRVCCLPDGSVDSVYAIDGLDGARLESREAFGRDLLDGHGDSFPIHRTAVRPGGQAVNAAIQADALGDDAILAGHLDHPVFSDLSFETHSMGEPSRIGVLAFATEEVLLAEWSPDAAEWSPDAIAATVPQSLLTAADAVCCGNWVTFRGLGGLFDRLEASVAGDPGDREGSEGRPILPRGVPIVVDPGPIDRVAGDDVRELFEALSAADRVADVAVSVNRAELRAAADAVGISPASAVDRLADVRRRIGTSAVVLHGKDVAAVATPAESTSVEMLEAGEVTFTTGAGDRFSGALACALARGWEWEPALALANACASRFVETGETGDAAAIGSFVEHRD